MSVRMLLGEDGNGAGMAISMGAASASCMARPSAGASTL